MLKLPFRIHVFTILVVAAALQAASVRAESSPTGQEIMERAAKRSQSAESRQDRPDYTYHKQTVTDELDSKGLLKDRQEKQYEVSVQAGLSQLHLTQLNGKELTPAERKKQDQKEAAELQKMTDRKSDNKGDERENFLTSDMISRYDFTLAGQKNIDGRPAYEITFKPKSPAPPIRQLTDRVLNQVAGTVWIDKQDYEIARAEIHLQGEVTVWGGVIGTVTQCNFTLERTRMPDGAWFNRYSNGYLEGRKLLEPIRYRSLSRSTEFKRRELASLN